MLKTCLGKCAVALVIASSWIKGAYAETLLENSIESRFQLDFRVSDEALAKFIPAGWDVNAATAGPAKDANLRVIFIDRRNITAPDGKPMELGANRIAYLAVPITQPSTGVTGQMIIAGLTADANDAPGPFGVYVAAKTHRMERSTSAGTNQTLMESEQWEFAAATGERLQVSVQYQRVPVNRAVRETKYFSAKDPNAYQISKADQGVNIARNASVALPDRVKEFRFKASGGRIGSLFDGKERVLSIDSFPWYNQAVFQP